VVIECLEVFKECFIPAHGHVLKSIMFDGCILRFTRPPFPVEVVIECLKVVIEYLEVVIECLEVVIECIDVRCMHSKIYKTIFSYRADYRVFRGGYRVFRGGYRVFRGGYRVFRGGYRVFRGGYRVYKDGILRFTRPPFL